MLSSQDSPLGSSPFHHPLLAKMSNHTHYSSVGQAGCQEGTGVCDLDNVPPEAGDSVRTDQGTRAQIYLGNHARIA